jgi:hypothetical protein
MLDLLSESGFEFWVPITIQKSKTDSEKADGKRWIEGIASTTDTDLQHEIVEQNGIDFAYFLKHGYFNNDHKPGFENKIGEPTECRVTAKGLYVKGFLYKDKKVANDVWEMANSLESSGAQRKLGFSIQGKVLRRNGKTIVKCWIQDIAITAAPINTNTWLDVVKGLNALPQDMWCDENGCYPVTPDMAFKAMRESEGKCCGACNCSGGARDMARKAAMSIPEEGMDLRKQEPEKGESEKALSAGSDGGRALTVESLEGQMADQNFGRTDPKHEKTKKSLVPDMLSFEESVAWLRAYRNLSQPEAHIVAKAVFHMNGLVN